MNSSDHEHQYFLPTSSVRSTSSVKNHSVSIPVPDADPSSSTWLAECGSFGSNVRTSSTGRPSQGRCRSRREEDDSENEAAGADGCRDLALGDFGEIMSIRSCHIGRHVLYLILLGLDA